MESLRSKMVDDPELAKHIRFAHLENSRSAMTKDRDQKLPETMVMINVSIPNPGTDTVDLGVVAIPLDGEIEIGQEMKTAFFKIIGDLKGDEGTLIEGLSSTEGVQVAGVSLADGINTKSVEVHTEGGSSYSGTVVRTIFADDSSTTFLVEAGGKVSFIGSTHPLPIECYRIEVLKTVDEKDWKELIGEEGVGLHTRENFQKLQEDYGYYARAIISALSATKEEISLLW